LEVPKYIQELSKLEDSILTRYDSDGNPVGPVTGDKSPAELADIKKSLGKNTQWSVPKDDPDLNLKTYLNSVRKSIYAQLADMVENAAPNSNIKELNHRFANVIEAQGLLKNRIALEHGTGGANAAIRKGEFWGGLAFSLFSPEPITKGLGIAGVADRMVRSVPGKMVTAKTLARTGEALQSPIVQGAVSKAGAVGQAARTASQDEDTSDWQKIQTSDGARHLIHPEDLAEAQRRDPKLKILDQPDQP